jgi:hypothetical protein
LSENSLATPTIAYVTAVAVVPTIADTLLLQAASCCRHHDVTVIFTAEIFHAGANVLTAVGTPSCVPDFLLLLTFPFWRPLLLLNGFLLLLCPYSCWRPFLLTSLLSLVYPSIAGGLAVAGSLAVAGGSAVAGILL